jgi:hypothetical protein
MDHPRVKRLNLEQRTCKERTLKGTHQVARERDFQENQPMIVDRCRSFLTSSKFLRQQTLYTRMIHSAPGVQCRVAEIADDTQNENGT